MKKINRKIWDFFFTHIMGIEFIPNTKNFNVKYPIGVVMCEREVAFETMTKISLGVYKLNSI